MGAPTLGQTAGKEQYESAKEEVNWDEKLLETGCQTVSFEH